MNRYALFATVLCASAVLMPRTFLARSPAAGKAEPSSKLEFERDAEKLRESLIKLAESPNKQTESQKTPYTSEQIEEILRTVNAPKEPFDEKRIAPTEVTKKETTSVYDEYKNKYEDVQKRRAAGERYIAQQMLANPEYADSINKALKGMLDADFPKMALFEETDPAKSIFNALPVIRSRDTLMRAARNELLAAEQVAGKSEKTFRIHLIIPILLQAAGAGSPAPTRSNESAKVSEIDPDKQIRQLKGVYNSIAESQNATIQQFEAQSSVDWVLKKTGLKRLERLDEK